MSEYYIYVISYSITIANITTTYLKPSTSTSKISKIQRAFGGAIAFAVGHMNGAHGLSAWRWLFIIEGAPSCASAVLVWFLLPDYPETASWLTAEEKELAAQRLSLEGSKGSDHAMSWEDAKATLTDWRLYAHYAVCFLCVFLPYPFLKAH